MELRLSEPQTDILTSNASINLALFGAGSGKSFLCGLVAYNFASRFPKAIGLLTANTYSQLTKSTLFQMKGAWSLIGVHEYREGTGEGHYIIGKQPPPHFTRIYNFDNYANTISFSWGACIYTASVDNFSAIDGISISYALCDEVKDYDPAAINEVILARLRQKAIWLDDAGNMTEQDTGKGFTPLYMFTTPAKSQFLVDMFDLEKYADEIRSKIYYPPGYFKKRAGNKLVVIGSTYLNEHNLSSEFIENYKSTTPSALHGMILYADPFSKGGGEAYYGFDRSLHVVKGLREREYNPDLPLHVSFDFNVKPYTTLLVFQIKDKKVYLIDEICSENNTAKACKVFMNRYGSHRGGLFVYGDPAGKSASTKTEEGQNDYTIIQRELKALKPILRVASKAPAVVMRMNWINAILEGSSPVSLLIDERCKNAINDFLYLKQAADGTKNKSKKTEDGVTFEEYGHTSDTTEYLLCKAFETDWNQFSKGSTGGKIHVVSTGKESKRF